MFCPTYIHITMFHSDYFNDQYYVNQQENMSPIIIILKSVLMTVFWINLSSKIMKPYCIYSISQVNIISI